MVNRQSQRQDRSLVIIIAVVVIAAIAMIAIVFSDTAPRTATQLTQSTLESNSGREGVTTTASGLQYEVITQGDGPRPAATDTVTVHYVGTLLDGTQFDSSYDRGEPASFPLNGVISGWTEGVQLMPVGSTYRFWIPPNLAYGANGRPPVIPPNSTLIFDITLVSIG